MIKRFLIVSLVTILSAFSYSYFATSSALAVVSNCVDVDVNAKDPATLPQHCLGGGGVGPDGFVFPLKTTKSGILQGSLLGSQRSVWCYTKQTNCHHHYNAADIFTATGTVVIAAAPGQVTSAHDSGIVGHTVSILGTDKRVYYYAHMNALRVTQGQNVTAQQELGTVGTSIDAMGTSPHLHFDMLPTGTRRISCSGASCMGYPFINVQPLLVPAYNALPQ